MDRWDRRVVVGVDGSVGGIAALRRAVFEARSRDASLISVLAWVPQGGEGVGRRLPCPPELLAIWRQDARERLRGAWEQALGGIPADLAVEEFVLRGPTGEVLVDVADRPDDLLVVGAGRPGPWRLVGGGAVTRYCVAHARCGVLAVPRPATFTRADRRRLARELSAPATG
ncbi:MAG TPA: universal stress protein [Pseudonocardiaceae bacterium]